jgi:hypothetical protein
VRAAIAVPRTSGLAARARRLSKCSSASHITSRTPAAPAGLLAGVPPLVAGTSIAADLQALIGAISAAGIDTRSIAFIAAPAQAAALSMQPWPNFDHKVIEVSTLAPGTVIAVAADGFVVAGEGVPDVRISKHGVFHMSDTPTDIGTGAGVAAPAVSMYQTNSFAPRCIADITWAVAPGAIAWVSGTTAW